MATNTKTEFGQRLVMQAMDLGIDEEVFIDEDFIHEVQETMALMALGGRRYRAYKNQDGEGFYLTRLAEEQAAVDIEVSP